MDLHGSLLGIVGLAATCGAWVLFQRWVRRHDGDREPEGECGGCGFCTCGRRTSSAPAPDRETTP